MELKDKMKYLPYKKGKLLCSVLSFENYPNVGIIMQYSRSNVPSSHIVVSPTN